MQTARFSSVVERSGQPELYLAWLPPEKDRALQQLIKRGRVMTVHQELRGTHKDFGTVGLHREKGGQIWIFPRSLRRFSEKRIVGIDYRQLAPTRHGAGPATKLKSGLTINSSGATTPTKHETVSAAQDEPSSPSKKAWQRKLRRRVPSVESKPSAPRTHAGLSSVEFGKVRRSPLPASDLSTVLRHVRRAMEELKSGKSVAAYERLARLVK